ncbi:hypothetical protein MKX67_02095 [Cytobacillus sp. FSL W7-1323]|uniref:Uncharacterized protein n=1 Tax=Cytobacillus kochii TaxID=859143 RepID=A0A248TGK4_9BACI|nr:MULTISPECIES: hypothetical protein [Cytobacillus]ASV67305.1 hypothetical protein CKF48_08210 [Cytobacillus kochii]MDQ0185504.1 quinol-cytochrome oxidoreductase complex cytochrome b subunit [Cytobacillus kochii]MEA1854958.1 hypothetical protein [Cytobacillus sp. OWB-43]MED1606214.1 hypothetical protein [Cytobacillus kochii]
MTTFKKMNLLSLFYALIAYFPVQLSSNVNRISRWTGINVSMVIIISNTLILIILLLGTAYIFHLTTKWLHHKRIRYFTSITWIPFFSIMMLITAIFLPFSMTIESPNPVTSIIILICVILYPIYILIVNGFIAMTQSSEQPLVDKMK